MGLQCTSRQEVLCIVSVLRLLCFPSGVVNLNENRKHDTGASRILVPNSNCLNFWMRACAAAQPGAHMRLTFGQLRAALNECERMGDL